MPSRRDCANAIRALAMDAVELAHSGHPGMPMGMADIAEVLWHDFLKFNPANPGWFDRDRFVLSNGHGSMLQYAVLHLVGFDIGLEDLKQFRQLHSATPGHPEYDIARGIETTTGPLGQGLANAVGMAIAEQSLAAHFNRDDFNIVDHYTYAFVGDGDLMEGLSHEACSLADTLGLGKLIFFYDDNNISIDGDVGGWFTDDTPKRFAAYGWHVVADVDGHDSDAIAKAIKAAQAETDKPSMICCKTTIGFGAPNLAGTAASHGAPLGEAEIKAAREQLNWPHAPFVIPDDIYAAWDCRPRGSEVETDWNRRFAQYERQYPELAKEFLRRQNGFLPSGWQNHMKKLIHNIQKEGKDDATRKLSQACLNNFAPIMPELIGGSADLSGSNATLWSEAKILSREQRDGNYIEYGVREFGMSAILNGLALHGGFIPYAGTFLTFSDYARNALRLAAMMQTRNIFIYSHDSIGLGEDGPTHQPIEQVSSLRLIPGLNVWRPCDGAETAVSWKQALEHNGPSCLLLTRQKVGHQQRDTKQLTNIGKGGYILWQADADSDIQAVLLATGSEVEIAMTAAQQLQRRGIAVRVVSLPCCDIFKKQDKTYRDSVLLPAVTKRIAIEAGVSDYWYQFVGDGGKVLGIDAFGASAPYDKVYENVGLTPGKVIEAVCQLLQIQNVNS